MPKRLLDLPNHRQQKESDCLAACAAMMLQAIGIEVPYWNVGTWHAVVLVGYDEQYLYVNDPAFETAPQAVLCGDLDLAWLAYDSYYAMVQRA